MSKIPTEINIKIRATFGSEWQRQAHLTALLLMLIAWEGHVAATHKQNDIMRETMVYPELTKEEQEILKPYVNNDPRTSQEADAGDTPQNGANL